jgi:octaprenyl-diphosphate synthase
MMTQRLYAVPAADDRVLTHPTELLREELEAVETVLLESSRSEVELISLAAHHILNAGGKRFRPQLTLLTTRLFEYDGPAAVPMAAAMELIHTATLVHDDIVDESDSRRGRATANYFWGNSASVLMGDYLVIKAFTIATEAGDPRLLRLLCDTIGRMCEGEVLQICARSEPELEIDAYLKIIDAKTGALMATCCRAGALLGGAALEQTEALAAFGRKVGLAFQIIDDILDYTGDEGVLGKPVGSDLREGKVTLPLIYALQRAPAADRKRLEEALEGPTALKPAEIEAVVTVIGECDGFDAARERAAAFIQSARRDLDMAPPGPARDGLLYLAEKSVERVA